MGAKKKNPQGDEQFANKCQCFVTSSRRSFQPPLPLKLLAWKTSNDTMRFILIFLFALIVHHPASCGLDVDSFIEELWREARRTFDLVGDQAHMARDDFEATFVTVALEAETNKILAAKGLTRVAIGGEDGEGGTLGSLALEPASRKKDAPESVEGFIEHLRVQARPLIA